MKNTFLLFSIVLSIINCFDFKYDAWNDGFYILNWSFDVHAATITYNLNVKTAGWVGIGFTTNGLISGSDVIIAYIDTAGQPQVIDGFYLENNNSPSPDTSAGGTNDLTNISGTYLNATTSITFTRKLNTGDPKHDYAVTQGATVQVIFWVRETGNPSTDSGVINPYTKMIINSIILVPSYMPPATVQTNYDIMKINIKNFKIPAQMTTYGCQYFKVDDLIRTHKKLEPTAAVPSYHAYKFEPENASTYIHHMIIYSCSSQAVYSPDVVECTADMNMFCSEPIALAGKTTAAFELPSVAGYIWGTGRSKLVWLEIHYNNRNLDQGQSDSSGFNIYYTSQLRPNNMGTAILGVPEQKISLTPGLSNVLETDTCPATCTQKFNSTGINIVYAFLHGHNLLQKIRTEVHFANGTVDNTTFRTDSFDFSTQFVKELSTPLHIHPGDSFTTICDYNTMNLNTTTLGGKGTNNEMCYSFVGYYPAEQGFSMCLGRMCAVVPYSYVSIPSSSSSNAITNGFIYLVLLVLFYI